MPERFTSRWDTLVFAVCIVLSLAARIAPAGVQTVLASGTRNTILAPLLEIQHQAERFRTSRARFAAVVAARDSAALAAMEFGAVREENDRLRELLDLGPRLPTRYVTAEVLHQSSPVDGLTLLLSAGAADGVRPMAPVLAPSGLLGVVRTVDSNRSVAVIWQHPDFRASAMTLEGTVFGIVAPAGTGGVEPLLELIGVPFGQRVPNGTRLFTAGFGGVYPRGVPLGEVTGVADEIEGLSRTYWVRPAVHPSAVSHVIILTGQALDLTDVFGQ